MTDYVDWPPPHRIAIPTQKTNLVYIPFTLLLSKIVSYTVTLQKENSYLSPRIGYRALSTCYTEYNKTSTQNRDKTNRIVGGTFKNTETKIPVFKVPIFRGDTLGGDEYISIVKTPSG